MQYEKLFSEGRIGSVTLKNRVVMAPMEVGMANPDGTPSEQLIAYYEERARNGLGLVDYRHHARQWTTWCYVTASIGHDQ